jgi:hypothetical protein
VYIYTPRAPSWPLPKRVVTAKKTHNLTNSAKNYVIFRACHFIATIIHVIFYMPNVPQASPSAENSPLDCFPLTGSIPRETTKISGYGDKEAHNSNKAAGCS